MPLNVHFLLEVIIRDSVITQTSFIKNDAPVGEAQEGKCVCSIYSRLSCVVVAQSVPNARH